MILAWVGLAAVSCPAKTTLVATGSVWKYFDGGMEPAGWKAVLFDDSAWSAGPGHLGFGDGDEATFISQTNGAGQTNLTFYFRHSFNLSDPSAFSNLLVRLRRDDGAVVYLNETEVFRSNLPLGPVNASTLAPVAAEDDGYAIFASPVSTALLLHGDNVLAVEVHQANVTSTDVSFDLGLLGNVVFQPPAVTISTPMTGASLGSSHLTIIASATDNDGPVASVDFYNGTTLLGVVTNAPYSLTLSNAPDGSYRLTAVAIDSTGLSATSAPVSVVMAARLVPSGADWKYLDDGSDQGTAWRQGGYNDEDWSNGVAPLGYGDDDEATLINGGPTTNRFITTYFRKAFSVANPALITNLVVRLLRDDGGVVYLNGIEVFRHNMPAGGVNFATTATAAIDDERFHAGPVNPAVLVPGSNILAVEIHQSGGTSSDVSFDLELRPNVPGTPPEATFTFPGENSSFIGPTALTLDASATDLDGAVAFVTFFDGISPLGTDATEPYSVVASNLTFGPHRLHAVATDKTGLTGTSAPVNITILSPPTATMLIPAGSVWRYLDTGVNQGTAWRAPSFDDNNWLSGPAKFGAGDPATTPISIRTTVYFRNTFVVTNRAAATNLAFRVLRDDGVVAYLNGVEIFRMNMPTNPIFYVTVPTTAIGGTNESHYFPTNINNALLRDGTNVLALELHQTQGTSDAGFDLELIGSVSPPAPPPALTIERLLSPMLAVRLHWPGSGFILQHAAQVNGPYTNLPTAISPHSVAPADRSQFYRLKTGP